MAQSRSDIDALITQAEQNLNSKPNDAVKVAEQAKAAADKSGYQSGAAKALSLIGVANYKIDQYAVSADFITQASKMATEQHDSSLMCFCTYWLGNLQVSNGQYSKALEYFKAGYDMAVASGDKKNMARCLDGKAGIYEQGNEDEKASAFYDQALQIAKEANFKEWYPGVIFSQGNMALKKSNYDAAIAKYNEAMAIAKETNNQNCIGNCLQQLAFIYLAKNETKPAMKNMEQAMSIYEQTGSSSSFSYGRLLMSSILLTDREYDLVIGLGQVSYADGVEKKIPELQRNAAKLLYQAYNAKGDKAQALKWLETLQKLSEQGQEEAVAKKMTQLELQAEFEKERKVDKEKQREMQSELDRQKLQRDASMIGAGLLLIIVLISFYFIRQKIKDNKIIQEEKQRSEALLRNILPEEIAKELMQKGESKARRYELATVLFADIRNFTLAAERLSPEKLVAEIDFYFQAFDEIIAKYKIEKIKTIGDAYMCVGGLPQPYNYNPEEVIKAAIDMQNFVKKTSEERIKNHQTYFEIRIGIHSGPLVAGIVGDTVNIAARFEQYGEVGRINVSAQTYELIKDHFPCSYHGKVELKNKGMVDMYVIDATNTSA
jgi:class 3 adenylate cyclase